MRTDDEGDCGGAAVRIGFGDVESIDCEGGRAVYITGGEWASPKECGRINGTYTPVFFGTPRIILAPLRSKGLLPLGTLPETARGRRVLRFMRLPPPDFSLAYKRSDSEFGGGRYFVAPQEEHLYPVVTVSSHALLTSTCSSHAASSVTVSEYPCFTVT